MKHIFCNRVVSTGARSAERRDPEAPCHSERSEESRTITHPPTPTPSHSSHRRSVAKRSVARRAFTGRSPGFTLLELLVVLVILGLLAGLVGPRLFGKADTAKVQTAETQIQMLKSALLTYRLDMGRFPSEQEGLVALNNPPSDDRDRQFWDGPYLDGEVPQDPWRMPYQYKLSPSHAQGFVLYSYGSDGKLGGEDIQADIGYLPDQ